MKRATKRGVWTAICVLLGLLHLQAQSSESQPLERLNSNAAFTINVPLNPTARYTNVAWGFTYGAGYNISKRHSVLGEVMWNSLLPTSAALSPIQATPQGSYIHGHGNLVVLNANYRLQFEGKVFGTYFIAGAGMYYRESHLSQHVVVGESVSCTPAWLWWGFSCESGIVTNNQTLATSSSTAPGGNVGVGFTVRLPDSKYKFYVESRYHYATNRGVPTKILPINVGVRF